jgi:hypothetical protein
MNGGLLLSDLRMPEFGATGSGVAIRTAGGAES